MSERKNTYIRVDNHVKNSFEELKKSNIKFLLLKKDSEVIEYLIEFYKRMQSSEPQPDPLSNAILISRFIDVIQSDDVQQLIEKKLLS